MGSGEQNVEKRVSQSFIVVDIHTFVVEEFGIAIGFSAFHETAIPIAITV